MSTDEWSFYAESLFAQGNKKSCLSLKSTCDKVRRTFYTQCRFLVSSGFPHTSLLLFIIYSVLLLSLLLHHTNTHFWSKCRPAVRQQSAGRYCSSSLAKHQQLCCLCCGPGLCCRQQLVVTQQQKQQQQLKVHAFRATRMSPHLITFVVVHRSCPRHILLFLLFSLPFTYILTYWHTQTLMTKESWRHPAQQQHYWATDSGHPHWVLLSSRASATFQSQR